MNIFIDTDIGSDVDDTIALLYALQHLSVKGITTVHGCAEKRAQIAEKILKAYKKRIPVYAGRDQPLVSEKIYLYGHEGHGILNGTEPAAKEGAVSFLEKRVGLYDSIIGIGPVTNIALYLQHTPVQPKQLYLMGGVLEKSGRYYPNYEKHNFKVDPDATDIVFHARVPVTILTTEVAKTVWMTYEEFEQFPKTQVFDYIRQNAKDILAARKQENAYMYDPLTIMMLVHPEYFSTKTKKNITVTTSINAKAAKKNLVETLWKSLL